MKTYANNSEKNVSLFLAYSRKDNNLRELLEKHLFSLKRDGLIHTWYDGLIYPGENWANEISQKMDQADIILLLVSAYFIASDYCYNVEMKKAIERHSKNEAIVVPIILKYCDWKETPFASFQVLPKGGNPIVSSYWQSEDLAMLHVVKEIKKLIFSIKEKKDEEINKYAFVIKSKKEEIQELNLELQNLRSKYRQEKARNEMAFKIENLSEKLKLTVETKTKVSKEYEELVNRYEQLKNKYEKAKDDDIEYYSTTLGTFPIDKESAELQDDLLFLKYYESR